MEVFSNPGLFIIVSAMACGVALFYLVMARSLKRRAGSAEEPNQ